MAPPSRMRQRARVDRDELLRLLRAFEDVITRLGEVATFDTVEAEVKKVEGIRVHVATPAALYRLKKDTVRPLDRRDAAALAERFNLKDGD